jgi:hypothetical protein
MARILPDIEKSGLEKSEYGVFFFKKISCYPNG